MSTLRELRETLELALDWYEPRHDGVVPRWVTLARAALVAEGQGEEIDFGSAEEVISGLDAINKHNAALHKEGQGVSTMKSASRLKVESK